MVKYISPFSISHTLLGLNLVDNHRQMNHCSKKTDHFFNLKVNVYASKMTLFCLKSFQTDIALMLVRTVSEQSPVINPIKKIINSIHSNVAYIGHSQII